MKKNWMMWPALCSALAIGFGVTAATAADAKVAPPAEEGTAIVQVQVQALPSGLQQVDPGSGGVANGGAAAYSNTNVPTSFVAPGGLGSTQLGDDAELDATCSTRTLVHYDIMTFAPGVGVYDVSTELWTDVLGGPGVPIPGTGCTFLGVANGALTPLDCKPGGAVLLPDNLWAMATFTPATAGWILADPAEIGFTADVMFADAFGLFFFGGAPYAGTWLNIFTVAPTGETCDDGLAVGPGTYFGTTIGGTGPDGPIPSCGLPSTNDDWWCYTATCDGTTVVTTENSVGLPDTVVAVFDSCLGPELVCDDDSGAGFTSTLSFPSTAGDTYKIAVTGWGGADEAYQLDITCLPFGGCCLPPVPGSKGYAIPVDPDLAVGPGVGLTSHTFTVPDSGIITDVDVDVDLSHTWVGDLDITITHVPSLTSVTLVTPFTPDDGADLDGVYVFSDGAPSFDGAIAANSFGLVPGGTYSGDNPLAVFNGLDKAGDWRIDITDNFAGDGGFLRNWSLSFVNAGAPPVINCVILGPVDCAAAGGTYNGDGTACSNDPATDPCDCNDNGIPDSVDIVPAPGAPRDHLIDIDPDVVTDNGITGCGGCPAGQVCIDTNLNGIPDRCGVEVSFVVPDAGPISDVDIALDIAHTWYGDLNVIVSHGGTNVRLLSNATPDDSSNLDGVYTLDDEALGTLDAAAVAEATGGPVPIPPGSYRPDNLLSAFDGMEKSGAWTLRITDHVGADTGTLRAWSILIDNPVGPAKDYPIDVIPDLAVPDGGLLCGAPCAAGEVCIDTDLNGSLDRCGREFTFIVPDSGIILDADIDVNLLTTNMGQANVIISHGGVSVRLLDRVPADNSDFDGVYRFDDEGALGTIEAAATAAGATVIIPPGSYSFASLTTPPQPHNLARFDGLDKMGVWTLRVTDHATVSPLTIRAWSIHLTNLGAPAFSTDCDMNGRPDECQTPDPNTIGACCVPGTGCTEVGSAAACTAIDPAAQFRGLCTACDDQLCNDNCATRINVTDGATPFNRAGATTDGAAHVTNPCNFLFGDDQIHRDIWFNYYATCTGRLFVDTCEGAGIDTRLAVYDGCACPPIADPIACNDDSGEIDEGNLGVLDPDDPDTCLQGGGNPPFESATANQVIMGQCYKIRVGGFAAGDNPAGDDVLTITCEPKGACCLPDNSCDGGEILAECDAQFGTFHAGEACGAFEACCLPGGICDDLDPLCCVDAGGAPQGPGSVCTATEACCFGPSCSNLDPLCCIEEGGTLSGGAACEGDVDMDGTDGECGDGCPNDPDDDKDGDGLCCGPGEDICCNDPDNDKDGDGMCGNVDPCPNDPDNDKDMDGMCGNVDPCPNDPDNDKDMDGLCGNVDPCPNDPDNDKDMDGLCGNVDPCPNDPANDSDMDGVCCGAGPGLDHCCTDPNKLNPGQCGCNNPDTDMDGDGFADCIDGCPTDPLKNHPGVCGCNVPDIDTDGDGVLDCNDICPGKDDNVDDHGENEGGPPNGIPDCLEQEIPTVSEWGMIVMALLLLIVGKVYFGNRRTALAGLGAQSSFTVSANTRKLPFAPAAFVKALAAVMTLALVGFALAIWLLGPISTTNLVGGLVSATLFAYLAHLWMVSREE